ncbi:hypothetical protein KKJ22_16330 [Xenorhabdus bovienii]|uniref:hypothetical protein n=1 Tax=Xenorhabdus bovienii TaxID=40576 RepID=UPI0023B2F180|nr:hypothetical protein [Xenorhabdus bovienii]MDE9447804.1 hypothetical protein [Xenorhabdus bovienii]MDE9499346.1 hypothetical protein [Xenorhabdus bovienii]
MVKKEEAIKGLKMAIDVLENYDINTEEYLPAICIVELCSRSLSKHFKDNVSDTGILDPMQAHVRSPLYHGQTYYTPTLGTSDKLSEEHTWAFSKRDIFNLTNERVFLNRSDADAITRYFMEI